MESHTDIVFAIGFDFKFKFFKSFDINTEREELLKAINHVQHLTDRVYCACGVNEFPKAYEEAINNIDDL